MLYIKGREFTKVIATPIIKEAIDDILKSIKSHIDSTNRTKDTPAPLAFYNGDVRDSYYKGVSAGLAIAAGIIEEKTGVKV